MPYEAQATIMGHLGRDADTKTTGSGQQVTEFSVAVGRKEKDEKVTDWYKVSVWRLPDWKRDALVKGALVLAVGSLQLRTYQKRDGSQGFSAEIAANSVQVIGERSEKREADPPHAFSQPKQGGSDAIDSSDLPF